MATTSGVGSIGLSIDADVKLTPTASEGGQVAQAFPNFDYGVILPDGTGSGQVKYIWKKVYTSIPSVEPKTVRLDNLLGVDIGQGPGIDALGQPWNTSWTIGLIVKNTSKNAATQIRVAAIGSPVCFGAVGDGVSIEPGGIFGWASPVTPVNISGGTGVVIDHVDVVNNADFEIMVFGR